MDWNHLTNGLLLIKNYKLTANLVSPKIFVYFYRADNPSKAHGHNFIKCKKFTSFMFCPHNRFRQLLLGLVSDTYFKNKTKKSKE